MATDKVIEHRSRNRNSKQYGGLLADVAASKSISGLHAVGSRADSGGIEEAFFAEDLVSYIPRGFLSCHKVMDASGRHAPR